MVRRLLHTALAGSVAVSMWSCAPTAPPSIRVAWRFSDARRCDTTGAVRVVIRNDEEKTLGCTAPGCAFACEDGEADAAASVDVSLPEGTRDDLVLRIEAESSMGAILYRGTVRPADRDPTIATALLRFIGGG